MRVDSTTGSEGEVIAFTERLLSERGWVVRRIPVSEGRDDLFAAMGKAHSATLSTHLDTVPPYIPPRLDGRSLCGRGSCDAKGIAAAMICAADRLRDGGVPIALLFVVGEEQSHDGAHAANAIANTSRVLVNGEPTECRLAIGTKGAMRFTVRTTGRAAHSAYPELGHSATRDLVELLHDLDGLELPHDDLLGDATINIGKINGGVADNVTAPEAEARLMARLVAPAPELLEILERWALGRATLEIGPTVPPVRLGTLPGFETSIVAFATDIPALSEWGTPYLFGPGSIDVAHTPDEFIDTGELVRAVDAYERIVRLALERAT